MTPDPAPVSVKRRRWLNTLKILVTLVLLAVILNQLRNLSFSNLVNRLDWQIFFYAFLVLVFHTLLGALRWRLLTGKFEINVPLIKLLKFYYIGSFVSFFLPTAIGGDLARIVLLRREVDSLEIASSTVIVERILGLLSIIVLFAFSLIFGIQQVIEISFFLPVVGFILVFIFILWFLFYFPENWLKKLFFFSPSLHEKVHNIFLALKSFRNETGLILQGLILSILFQSAMIVVYYLLALAINLKIPFQYFLLFMPLVWVLSLIPLSLNGLGIREGSFIYLFSLLGYSSELLSFVSMLGVVLLISQGLIGGALFLFNKDERNLITATEN